MPSHADARLSVAYDVEYWDICDGGPICLEIKGVVTGSKMIFCLSSIKVCSFSEA